MNGNWHSSPRCSGSRCSRPRSTRGPWPWTCRCPNPYLAAGRGGTVYLRVSLTGAEADRGNRAAGNIAIVLDRSGSMDGEKIERAKEAALLAVDMLDPRDIVSVVTYSDTVHVLVPRPARRTGNGSAG